MWFNDQIMMMMMMAKMAGTSYMVCTQSHYYILRNVGILKLKMISKKNNVKIDFYFVLHSHLHQICNSYVRMCAFGVVLFSSKIYMKTIIFMNKMKKTKWETKTKQKKNNHNCKWTTHRAHNYCCCCFGDANKIQIVFFLVCPYHHITIFSRRIFINVWLKEKWIYITINQPNINDNVDWTKKMR